MFISISSQIKDTVPVSLSLKCDVRITTSLRAFVGFTTGNTSVLTKSAHVTGWYLHEDSVSSWPALPAGCWPAPDFMTGNILTHCIQQEAEKYNIQSIVKLHILLHHMKNDKVRIVYRNLIFWRYMTLTLYLWTDNITISQLCIKINFW